METFAKVERLKTKLGGSDAPADIARTALHYLQIANLVEQTAIEYFGIISLAVLGTRMRAWSSTRLMN